MTHLGNTEHNNITFQSKNVLTPQRELKRLTRWYLCATTPTAPAPKWCKQLIIIMLCRASTDIVKAATNCVANCLSSFVSWLSERQSPPARSTCLQPVSSDCVSVYRPSSVRRVPLPYHRCHCRRRHQRHQRPITRTNLKPRRTGDEINRTSKHKNTRLPRNMLA